MLPVQDVIAVHQITQAAWLMSATSRSLQKLVQAQDITVGGRELHIISLMSHVEVMSLEPVAHPVVRASLSS